MPCNASKRREDEIDRLVSELFSVTERKQAREIVTPFLEVDSRLPKYILQFSRGNVESLEWYVEAAKQDYRDIIYWTENPKEARRDTFKSPK